MIRPTRSRSKQHNDDNDDDHDHSSFSCNDQTSSIKTTSSLRSESESTSKSNRTNDNSGEPNSCSDSRSSISLLSSNEIDTGSIRRCFNCGPRGRCCSRYESSSNSDLSSTCSTCQTRDHYRSISSSQNLSSISLKSFSSFAQIDWRRRRRYHIQSKLEFGRHKRNKSELEKRPILWKALSSQSLTMYNRDTSIEDSHNHACCCRSCCCCSYSCGRKKEKLSDILDLNGQFYCCSLSCSFDDDDDDDDDAISSNSLHHEASNISLLRSPLTSSSSSSSFGSRIMSCHRHHENERICINEDNSISSKHLNDIEYQSKSMMTRKVQVKAKTENETETETRSKIKEKFEFEKFNSHSLGPSSRSMNEDSFDMKKSSQKESLWTEALSLEDKLQSSAGKRNCDLEKKGTIKDNNDENKHNIERKFIESSEGEKRKSKFRSRKLTRPNSQPECRGQESICSMSETSPLTDTSEPVSINKTPSMNEKSTIIVSQLNKVTGSISGQVPSSNQLINRISNPLTTTSKCYANNGNNLNDKSCIRNWSMNQSDNDNNNKVNYGLNNRRFMRRNEETKVKRNEPTFCYKKQLQLVYLQEFNMSTRDMREELERYKNKSSGDYNDNDTEDVEEEEGEGEEEEEDRKRKENDDQRREDDEDDGRVSDEVARLSMDLAEFARKLGCVHCECRHQLLMLVNNEQILNRLTMRIIRDSAPTTTTTLNERKFHRRSMKRESKFEAGSKQTRQRSVPSYSNSIPISELKSEPKTSKGQSLVGKEKSTSDSIELKEPKGDFEENPALASTEPDSEILKQRAGNLELQSSKLTRCSSYTSSLAIGQGSMEKANGNISSNNNYTSSNSNSNNSNNNNNNNNNNNRGSSNNLSSNTKKVNSSKVSMNPRVVNMKTMAASSLVAMSELSNESAILIGDSRRKSEDDSDGGTSELSGVESCDDDELDDDELGDVEFDDDVEVEVEVEVENEEEEEEEEEEEDDINLDDDETEEAPGSMDFYGQIISPINNDDIAWNLIDNERSVRSMNEPSQKDTFEQENIKMSNKNVADDIVGNNNKWTVTSNRNRDSSKTSQLYYRDSIENFGVTRQRRLAVSGASVEANKSTSECSKENYLSSSSVRPSNRTHLNRNKLIEIRSSNKLMRDNDNIKQQLNDFDSLTRNDDELENRLEMDNFFPDEANIGSQRMKQNESSSMIGNQQQQQQQHSSTSSSSSPLINTQSSSTLVAVLGEIGRYASMGPNALIQQQRKRRLYQNRDEVIKFHRRHLNDPNLVYRRKRHNLNLSDNLYREDNISGDISSSLMTLDSSGSSGLSANYDTRNRQQIQEGSITTTTTTTTKDSGEGSSMNEEVSCSVSYNEAYNYHQLNENNTWLLSSIDLLQSPQIERSTTTTTNQLNFIDAQKKFKNSR